MSEETYVTLEEDVSCRPPKNQKSDAYVKVVSRIM